MLYTKYVLNKDMYTRSGGKWNLKTAIKYPICSNKKPNFEMLIVF